MNKELEVKKNDMVLFESQKIRKQEYDGEWYYSIVDIITILTESKDPTAYWRKLKQRLTEEGFIETVTKFHGLKMIAKDGKMRLTDCATRETIFRLIQSIPSQNAEPFKLWFARLAEERIQEVENPELAVERARQTYLNKGYSEEWTNARMKSIPARKELTDEWKNRGALTNKDFAVLTNDISKGTFGITTNQHKAIKNLNDNQSLRDNMSAMELALMTLAEVTTTELHKANDSQGMNALRIDAQDGGQVAANTRRDIEKRIGKRVVTKENALDFTNKRKIETKEKEILK